MTDNKFFTYSQEVEIMYNKMYDIFNENVITAYPHLHCKKCPYYDDYEVCIISNILKLQHIIAESNNLCYYNSILGLVYKYYPEFNNILNKIIEDYRGRNITEYLIVSLREELKNNLSFKYIDDMFFESEQHGYHLVINVIFRFKGEIISRIIDKVYEEIKETESFCYL